MTADKIPTPLEWLDERLATAAYEGAPLVTVSAWHLARVRDELRRLHAELETGAAELVRAARELERAK